MRDFCKKIMLVLSVVILTLPIFSTTVQAETTPTVDIQAKAGLAFDEKTGQVLYSQNADQKMAIGSITKIVTLYLVTKALKENRFTDQDTIVPTKEQADMTKDLGLSNVELSVDQAYSVKDLYNAAWIVSSNSAAMMLADKVSGSQKAFIKLMRKTLKEWGIKDAEIYNVSGLNNSDLKDDSYLGNSDSENKLSPNDIGIIVKHVLDKYPEILQTTSQSKLSFPVNGEVKTYDSVNLMLKGARDYQEGFEFDGLKTGTTKQAGESFVGTLPLENTRIVTIVMNAQGEKSDVDKRFRSTQKLIHYVKDNFEHKEVLQKDQKVTVNKKEYKVNQSVYLWVPKNFNVENLSYNESSNDLGFTATHKKQTVKLIAANTASGYLPFKKADVKKVIHKKTSQKSWWDSIVEFFNNLFNRLF
ncbi:D-alanyl-D-alanine carboxypeptidase [Companilactobacillus suantsaicola]|uniref:D-alanyl-D-alanine carboxypeptidase n=1 Tax=Companilactobacillus suantsaicola TaxID=2487723 RepID=A0A4Z0JHL5_9LACO|nr:D-alanyl-D-alanine carboxypeptidase family protein [Companilactobacillus suantsaicola]TGD21503.1 D-alanyl-D-alanine carboxypeptidase [Companilactobacillus suantsaicola]